jgi:hypothetical protein
MSVNDDQKQSFSRAALAARAKESFSALEGSAVVLYSVSGRRGDVEVALDLSPPALATLGAWRDIDFAHDGAGNVVLKIPVKPIGDDSRFLGVENAVVDGVGFGPDGAELAADRFELADHFLQSVYGRRITGNCLHPDGPGATPFDATQAVLCMPLEEIHALRDYGDVAAGLVPEGGITRRSAGADGEKVEVVASVLRFFAAPKLSAITDEMVEGERDKRMVPPRREAAKTAVSP